MAKSEGSFQFSSNEFPTQCSTQDTHWEFIFDMIGQKTSLIRFGGSLMSMDPFGEWTFGLLVSELAAFDIIPVDRNPVRAKRTLAHFQDNLVFVGDSSLFFKDLDLFPRGRQSFEGLWTFMPLE